MAANDQLVVSRKWAIFLPISNNNNNNNSSSNAANIVDKLNSIVATTTKQKNDFMPIWGLPARRIVLPAQLEDHFSGSDDDASAHTYLFRVIDRDLLLPNHNEKIIYVTTSYWGGISPKEGLYVIKKAAEFLALCNLNQTTSCSSILALLPDDLKERCSYLMSPSTLWGSSQIEDMESRQDKSAATDFNCCVELKFQNRAWANKFAVVDILVPPDDANLLNMTYQIVNFTCCLTAPAALTFFCNSEKLFHEKLNVEGPLFARRLLLERRVDELPPRSTSLEDAMQHCNDDTEFLKMACGAANGFDPEDFLLSTLRARVNQKNQDTLMSEATDSTFKGPFLADYGFNIFAHKAFANYGCVYEDCALICLGSDVWIGPSVRFFTTFHSMDPKVRSSGRLFSAGIQIESKVWIGGNSIICPGVRIGSNSVIAAGSVVVDDVLPGALYAGNPARLVRFLPGCLS